MLWRYALASGAGSSHVVTGLPCQDSSFCSVIDSAAGPVLVATVSDGAGSAARSEVGSHLACASFFAEVTAFITATDANTAPERAQIEAWLADLETEIAQASANLELSPRDLACTFVGAVLAPAWSMFCQVGDGGIVVRSGAAEAAVEPSRAIDEIADPEAASDQGNGTVRPEFRVIFWPEQGQYANETFFATQPGAAEHLQFAVESAPLTEIALFSDGLQRMVLSYAGQAPFYPFFRRMFVPVRAIAPTPGEDHILSRALAVYLGSSTVAEHTDDDVSLILATQLTPADVPTVAADAAHQGPAAGAVDSNRQVGAPASDPSAATIDVTSGGAPASEASA